MLVGYERATGGIIARPAPKAGPALRSGIEPERPFAASGNRPGPTATSAQSRNLNEGHCSGPAGWPMSLRQRLSCRAQSYGTTDHRNVLQVGRHVLSGPVSGRSSPVGTPVTSGKHSVECKWRASWRKRIRRQRGCSSFMSRSVLSAMTTARFVVVDCIYGVVCGPRGGGGSWNWRTDGQLGAEPGCGAGDACGAGGCERAD
jgi:hypothetical protein